MGFNCPSPKNSFTVHVNSNTVELFALNSKVSSTSFLYKSEFKSDLEEGKKERKEKEDEEEERC